MSVQSPLFARALTLGQYDAEASLNAPESLATLVRDGYAADNAQDALQSIASGYLAGALSGLTQQDVAGRLQTVSKVGKVLRKDAPSTVVYRVRVTKSKIDGALSASVVVMESTPASERTAIFNAYCTACECHARAESDLTLARGALSLASDYADSEPQIARVAALSIDLDRIEAARA